MPKPPTVTMDDVVLPEWLEPVRDAVRTMDAKDLSSFVPPKRPKPREGAVLVLFGDGPEGPDLLLTERAHTMRSQPGQVSFPGGSTDDGEDAVATALREAQEETGLDPDGVDVFAVLPRDVAERLRKRYRFYVWDERTGAVRWMTSFDTTEADVEAFAAALAEEMASKA